MTVHQASPSAFVLADPPAGYVDDPYPHLAALRESSPLCRQPDGSWIVSRYDDVRDVLTDAERFSSDKQVDFRPKFGDSPLFEHHTMSLVFNDAPYHTRVRKLLAPFFAAQTLRRLQDRVEQMVDELLDRAAERQTLDIVGDFAIAVPLNLIGDLLGVPRDEREPLREWANLILGGLDPSRTPEQLAAGNRAVEDFKAYLRELIRWKRAHPAQAQDTDILWALIQSHDAGGGLTELEIIHNSIFMLNAGHDTTASLISNGIDLLLRHPAQCARLASDPALMRTAVEEMLRAESPLQFGNRRARTDVTVAGERLAAGSFLHVAIAAANHDPRMFDKPDAFDVGRDPNRHLAFGHGPHFCAGNAVARMEASIAFRKLLSRHPRLSRAGPTVRAQRTRFRVIEALPVRLD
ncbi:MAG TPA: cytochrome P450 [Burkholderiaceae bacterium]|jgi:hypothetical protein|nr:cytochrome P450 [Burkholderiaceae bacterium]